MKNVVQPLIKFKKTRAIELRKEGLSYSLIQKKLSVPKSTLSSWLKSVTLTEPQIKKLEEKRLEVARTNSQNRILQTTKLIEEIKNNSSKDIGKISKREFWLMGIILYWRERAASGNEDDIRNGIRFTNSNPDLIKLFLDWLQEVGNIQDREINLDIFVSEDRKASISEVIAYWSKISGFPENYFNRIYYQKESYKKIKSKNSKSRDLNHKKDSLELTMKIPKRSQFGFLRIRVKASSMLARQIAGWIKGVKEYYKY